MIKYILTDIEGTTTSINFVHEVLFPYSYERLESYLKENIDAHQNLIGHLATEITNTNLDHIINTLKRWIKEDKKHPTLKTIQGYIWQQGYENGEIKGHLYDDVKTCLLNWKSCGLNLGVYSSGSVLAQRLLFGHSLYGDLNHLFSHNFDTQVGHKRETQSYQNILQEIKQNVSDVLFLSDIEEELKAAQNAGFQVIQLIRDNLSFPQNEFQKVRSFHQIKF